MAWSTCALQLAALLAASAALQQVAAVKVATADEFVAALKAGDESIEVTDHLYLNTGSALELAAEVSNAGYLLSFEGVASFKISGECTHPPPQDMSDGLPANLVSSNEWPYAKLPPLTSGQCVLRIASGFAQLFNGGVLHLENLVISAPYLFGRNEAVAPTAADTPPATPPRGDDYVEEYAAAPNPYTLDYEDLLLPVDYAAPGPYDASYGEAPASAPGNAPSPSTDYGDVFVDYNDIAPAPGPSYDYDYAAPPRPYEGREAYPDYEDADYNFDPTRYAVLNGDLIYLSGTLSFDEAAPTPAPTAAPSLAEVQTQAYTYTIPQTPEAPQPTQLYMTNVVLAGGGTHVSADASSLYAEGTSFIDGERNSVFLSAESTASLVDCIISNNGDAPVFGGAHLLAASVMRAANVTFANNGEPNDYDYYEGDSRFGVWLEGAKTRLYTDSPVNVRDGSQGEVLPLADAPAGPFLTKP